MVQLDSDHGNARPALATDRIVAGLKDRITDGTYGAGSRLPSTRALAAELGVSRTTVTVAYEQLAAEGYLETRQGAAARVADGLDRRAGPDAARPGDGAVRLSGYARRALSAAVATSTERQPIDFRYGDLAASDFPWLAWRKALGAALLRRPSRLIYEEPGGPTGLRTALQAYLWRARGIACDAEQIIVVNGSQQGIDLCVRALVDPGDRVVIEDPGYPAARASIAAAGAEIVAAPVDAHGLRTETLGAAGDARLAFVTPSHQFPLGGVLPIGRRRELIAWAASADAWVIEDDYDAEYRYGSKPVEALASIDGLRSVVYVGTLSKTLSPRLRLGYVVAPRALVPVLQTVKRTADRHSSGLEQAALADFIASGAYERHVRRVRRRNGDRREALLEALAATFGDRVIVEGEAAGLHVVVWTPELPRLREAELVAAAAARGVGLYPVSPLYWREGEDAVRPAGFILGYAPLEAPAIRQGVALLREALDALSRD